MPACRAARVYGRRADSPKFLADGGDHGVDGELGFDIDRQRFPALEHCLDTPQQPRGRGVRGQRSDPLGHVRVIGRTPPAFAEITSASRK